MLTESRGISAKMVRDSVSEAGIRLSTIQVTMPKFLLAQLNTHRMFSRNAASSRAIPTSKLIERVKNDPVVPIYWGKNKPGMQANEEIKSKDYARCIWETSRSNATISAQTLDYEKVHKQIANRLLEPFMYVDVLITATEWDNFFMLRLEDIDPATGEWAATQPEMREVARVMRNAMDFSEPLVLLPDQWHLPYIEMDPYRETLPKDMSIDDAIKASVARCARVSYINHDQSNPDLKKDLELYELLHKEKHLSPFEHIATAMPIAKGHRGNSVRFYSPIPGLTHMDVEGNLWSGNFRGWSQYRQMI